MVDGAAFGLLSQGTFHFGEKSEGLQTGGAAGPTPVLCAVGHTRRSGATPILLKQFSLI